MEPYPGIDELLAEATVDTGLEDFGEPRFRVGLGVVLESLEHDARLTPEGQALVLGIIRRRLRNRLHIAEWYRTHPELESADPQTAGPVDINGLPRTGTTALGNMMSLDPQFRCLRTWEQDEPVPPPVAGHEHEDPRRARAAGDIARTEAELAAKHLFELDASTEDTEVLGLEFAAQQMPWPVFRYFAWWRTADHRGTFAYHRRVTRLLESRCPPNLWLFKAPHHDFHLEALLSAYPGARFIMTHRDPAKVVPSYASLITSMYPPGTMANHDPADIGPMISEHMRIGLEFAIAARGRIGADRFFDVDHRAFTAAPFEVLKKVYDYLGLELTPQVRRDMASWLEAHHTGAHGAHRYTAEQFGLSTARIRSEYSFYTDYFDLDLEP